MAGELLGVVELQFVLTTESVCACVRASEWHRTREHNGGNRALGWLTMQSRQLKAHQSFKNEMALLSPAHRGCTSYYLCLSLLIMISLKLSHNSKVAGASGGRKTISGNNLRAKLRSLKKAIFLKGHCLPNSPPPPWNNCVLRREVQQLPFCLTVPHHHLSNQTSLRGLCVFKRGVSLEVAFPLTVAAPPFSDVEEPVVLAHALWPTCWFLSFAGTAQ